MDCEYLDDVGTWYAGISPLLRPSKAKRYAGWPHRVRKRRPPLRRRRTALQLRRPPMRRQRPIRPPPRPPMRLPPAAPARGRRRRLPAAPPVRRLSPAPAGSSSSRATTSTIRTSRRRFASSFSTRCSRSRRGQDQAARRRERRDGRSADQGPGHLVSRGDHAKQNSRPSRIIPMRSMPTRIRRARAAMSRGEDRGPRGAAAAGDQSPEIKSWKLRRYDFVIQFCWQPKTRTQRREKAGCDRRCGCRHSLSLRLRTHQPVNQVHERSITRIRSMDQLRKAWEWFQRQHFWVLIVVAILVALGCMDPGHRRAKD